MSETRIARGTPAFRRVVLALVAGGFSTFAQLYCVQPLMPIFADEFGISAATASLAVSATTATLAISMIFAGTLSETIGRKPLMVASVFGSAILLFLSAFVRDWHQFVVLRALTGIALSGLPSVAMAYVSEEIETRSVGLVMGLYIGGSGLGGMTGRFAAGVIADHGSWRVALEVVGGLGLLAALIFSQALAPSRNFTRRRMAAADILGAFGRHLADPALRWLFALAFLMMGSFVTIYNYLGFRLLAPPFSLSQTQVGAIFIVYLAGVGSSAAIGALGDLIGRRRVLWATIVCMLVGLALTTTASVALIVLGMALYTFGFFGGHSVASSWVGRRAEFARAQAASLYLLAYYLGSSVVGTVGGVALAHGGWLGVVGMVAVLLLVALAGALRLTRIPPPSPAPKA